MANEKIIYYLFEKYLSKECTPEEIEELVDLLQDQQTVEMLKDRMRELWDHAPKEGKNYPVDWQQMYEEITNYPSLSVRTGPFIRKRTLLYAAAAVAIFIVMVGGWYFLNRNESAQKKQYAQKETHDVAPGGNRAVLTLAHGKKIILNQAVNGTLASQGITHIIKTDTGELVYRTGNHAGASSGVPEYNTLSTPRGGQYQLQLSDGTKVWLNDASSIRYPVAFSGNERIVEVTGEVYFEVAPNSSKPFIVKRGNVEIKVLGTHFNINAYTDEPTIKVTLLEGSVRVTQTLNRQSSMVTPGQQVQINKEGDLRLVKSADLEEIMAWKNGLFIFHDDDLMSVMRELSRWYNVEVIYQGNVAIPSHFTGAIRRQVNLSEVLNMLELTGGAHFNIEDNKIIVTK